MTTKFIGVTDAELMIFDHALHLYIMEQLKRDAGKPATELTLLADRMQKEIRGLMSDSD